MFQKQQIIISSYLEGKSYRGIAKEMGINRKTVAKYVKEYEEVKLQLLNNAESQEGDTQELIDKL